MSDERKLPASEQELKERILSSMSSSFKGEETSRWIAAIQEDSMDEAEEAVATGTKENKLSNSMSSLIDALFDHFKRYSFEFNRIQENKELEVHCERPTSMRTSAEYMDMGKTIKFCLGHLSSKKFALIIQGEESSIRAYLTPVEYLIGFKPGQTDFPVFLHMKRVANAQATDFIWSIDGKPLAMTSIPALARRLFTQLVKVQRGEATYDEKFVFDPHEPEAPIDSSIDRTFERDDAATFVSDKPKTRPAPDLGLGLRSYAVASTSPGVPSAMPMAQAPVNPAPSYQAPPPAQPPVQAFAQPPAPPAVQPRDFPVAMQMPPITREPAREIPKEETVTPEKSEPTQLQVPLPTSFQAPLPAPLPPPPQIPASLPASLPAPAPAPLPVSPPAQPHFFHAAEPEKTERQTTQNIEKEAAEANRKVAHAIKNLFDTVDGSISGLTALGVEAMHNDDIASVGEIMKHTKGLKALRDSMVQLSKEWQKNL
jgi:hypothetical protein